LQRILDRGAGLPHTAGVTPASRTRGPPGVATPGASSFWGSIVNRTVFLIDGFNVYHSLREAESVTGHRLRWLDLHGLCSALLHLVPGRCDLDSVVYLSALARHLESSRPGTVARHLRYIDALQATGVQTVLGHFRRRATRCPLCGGWWQRWEEKKTDVAIATRLLRLAAVGECERLVVVSGDTDIVPAIVEARDVWAADDGVVFPVRRANAQLRQVASWAANLDVAWYERHQLPERLTAADGRTVVKPAAW
jgi:hypothetical protein